MQGIENRITCPKPWCLRVTPDPTALALDDESLTTALKCQHDRIFVACALDCHHDISNICVVYMEWEKIQQVVPDLDCHPNVCPMQEDTSFSPGGKPGAFVAARAAQSADSLMQGHHSMDEGCQQSGLPIFCHQDLIQGLSTQHIPLQTAILCHQDLIQGLSTEHTPLQTAICQVPWHANM